MPRRNRKARRRQPHKSIAAEPERVLTTDGMARDLVRRGLASEDVLGPEYRSNTYTRSPKG